MILDTRFIVDVMRNDEAAIRKTKELIAAGELQIVTSPSLFELYSGLNRSNKPETEKKKILHTLSNLLIWHLDADGAEKGGEIDARLVTEGRKIDPIDSMIAGIALSRNQTIVTRNQKHFSRIPGLKLEGY